MVKVVQACWSPVTYTSQLHATTASYMTAILHYVEIAPHCHLFKLHQIGAIWHTALLQQRMYSLYSPRSSHTGVSSGDSVPQLHPTSTEGMFSLGGFYENSYAKALIR